MIVATEHARARDVIPRENTDAFRATFFEYYARIYAIIFRLVGNRADAEDLALETFIKLWQTPPPRADNLGGWLYRVATRLGYNSLRDAKRRAQYEESAGRDALADARDPAREAERDEERARVRAALSRMSERNAQLLILRHSGLAYKEIAQTLGVSANSIGTLLARAEDEFLRRYET